MHTKQYPNSPISTAIDHVRRWAAANGDRVISFTRPYDEWEPNRIVFSDGSVMTAEYNRWDEDLKVHWWSVRWVDRSGTVIVHRVGYDPIEPEPIIEDDDYVQTKVNRRLDGWVKDLVLSDDGYKLTLIDVDNNVIGHFEGSDWRDDFELM